MTEFDSTVNGILVCTQQSLSSSVNIPTCNDVILEITQIGKQCHNGCEIFKIMGDCIMPREGVFARVIKGGMISEGDEMVYA